MGVNSAILSQPVDVGQLPASGLIVSLSAGAEERRRLAEAYDLRDVTELAAEATIVPASKGAVVVEGRVTADIVQTCVVSLAPVEQRIDEPITARFVRPDSPEARHFHAGAEVQIGAHEEDPPDVLDDTTIDFGAIVEEHFVLAIDPYPRAPGAELAGYDRPPESPKESPFAALAALAKGDRDKR